MSELVTLELPEPLVESARAVAVRTHRQVEDVLVAWLDRAASEVPLALLPDEQVLALRDLEMDAGEQGELSDLLARQREGQLTGDKRTRLDVLLTAYRRGMMRKAEALKVAVERGLQPPLS
jgi:hypothetical protein